METSVSEPTLTPVQVSQPKNKPLVIPVLLVILLLLLCSTAFLYYQNMQLKNMLASYQTQPVVSPTPTAYQSPIPTIDPIANWKTYTGEKYGFSIKYPAGWRVVDTLDVSGSVGFGPKEIGEDVLWAINIFDTSVNSINNVVDDLGKQFTDRKQITNKISVNGNSATRVITTTATIPDWYYETIIFETGNKIITISNGAIKDENLPFNRGVPVGTTFGQFYSTFKFTK